MDLETVYIDEIPTQEDILRLQLHALEALGLFALDLCGATTAVSRLAAIPTAPPSLSVKVGPGSIYQKRSIIETDWGVRLATGGLPADVLADHQILKQGLHRDTETFALTAPVVAGQSIVHLVQARLVEQDETGTSQQFYNTANPDAPISDTISPRRVDKCVLSIKAGASATTGTQVPPAADAGWVPVWNVTIAYGATTITAGNIVQNGAAPLLATAGGGGGGGGGGGLSAWQVVAAAYTAVSGDRLIATMGTAYTINLPASPAAGAEVWLKVNAATNNLTIGRNGHTIAGSATNLTVDEDNTFIIFVYDGADWRV